MIKKFKNLTIAGLVVVILPGLASAQSLQEIAKYKAWRVFKSGSGETMSCHISSEPRKKTPSNVRRGEIFISISHRPGQGVYDEVSLRIGYPFSSSSKPFAQIGKDTFSFFTGAAQEHSAPSWAWMENAADHALFIKTLKAGTRMRFKGTSARGTLTTDEYSLMGFTAAYNHLNKVCPK